MNGDYLTVERRKPEVSVTLADGQSEVQYGRVSYVERVGVLQGLKNLEEKRVQDFYLLNHFYIEQKIYFLMIDVVQIPN